MAKKNEMGREIFAMRGVPDKGEKVGLFKKWPYQFNAYENGIFVRCVGKEKYIHINDIEHIYRKDNLFEDKMKWRSLVMYYYQDGERRCYKVADDNFPGLIEKMEGLYKNEWKQYAKNYPESLKWYTALISNWLIVADRPHDIFGALNDNNSFIDYDRNMLINDWGINNKSDLIVMCNKMLACPSVENSIRYFELKNENEIPEELMKIRPQILVDPKRTITAYDLYRVILLAYFGYTARYFNIEEAMEWCFKAGTELQKIYINWDDFYTNYLLGYCYWSEQDADLINTNANKRKRAYEETKEFPTHPWQIPWNTTLKKEW